MLATLPPLLNQPPKRTMTWTEDVDFRYRNLLALNKLHWPDLKYAQKHLDVIHSEVENTETVIVAGNKLGKDWGAGLTSIDKFIAPWLFFPIEKFREIESRRKPDEPVWQVHTRRIVTTSVDGDQLRNLWGEISRFIARSKIPLSESQGGPLVVNMRDISLREERGGQGNTGQMEPLNYLIGRVTGTGEGISGAHAAYAFLVIDEASGASNQIYEFGQGWMQKLLVFGNPNDCENFYRDMIRKGDLVIA